MLMCLQLERNKFGHVKTRCFNNFIYAYTRRAASSLDLYSKVISIETISFEQIGAYRTKINVKAENDLC